MKYVVGFLMFWYDFLIGDCWQIAAGIVAALALVAVLAAAQPSLAEPLGPAVAVAIAAVLSGTVWLAWRQSA